MIGPRLEQRVAIVVVAFVAISASVVSEQEAENAEPTTPPVTVAPDVEASTPQLHPSAKVEASPGTTESAIDVPTSSTQPSGAPTDPLSDMPDFGAALVRMLVVLVGIIVLILLLAKLLPRLVTGRSASGGGKLIRVLDVARLEPRKAVYVIEVDGQRFLVGTSETGVHLIADRLGDAPQSGEAGATGQSFAARLRRPDADSDPVLEPRARKEGA